MADRETNLSNFFETTLNGILATGVENMTLTAAPTSDGTSNIAAPYFLVIDPDNASSREVVLVTASSGVTVSTMTRDVEGRHGVAGSAATAPTHVDGTTVRMAVIKEMFDDVHDRIDADETTNAAHRSSTSNPHTVTFTQLGLKDEDDMSSNSATHASSQQSVKAYVDTQVATKASLGIVIALS